MKEISNLQLIKVEGNKRVVRFYDQDKDCFVRICKTENINIVGKNGSIYCSEKLLSTDEGLWVIWEGCLYPIQQDNFALLLQVEKETFRSYDVSDTGLPFKFLLVWQDGQKLKGWYAVNAVNQNNVYKYGPIMKEVRCVVDVVNKKNVYKSVAWEDISTKIKQRAFIAQFTIDSYPEYLGYHIYVDKCDEDNEED